MMQRTEKMVDDGVIILTPNMCMDPWKTNNKIYLQNHIVTTIRINL